MIQLNDFKRMASQYGDELVAAASRVISSGWYVLGEEVALSVFQAVLHRHTYISSNSASHSQYGQIHLRCSNTKFSQAFS